MKSSTRQQKVYTEIEHLEETVETCRAVDVGCCSSCPPDWPQWLITAPIIPRGTAVFAVNARANQSLVAWSGGLWMWSQCRSSLSLCDDVGEMFLHATGGSAESLQAGDSYLRADDEKNGFAGPQLF